jgi:hypothetical protein
MKLAIRCDGLAWESDGGQNMAQGDLSRVEVAKVVDERSHACPGPLIETKKAIVQLKR